MRGSSCCCLGLVNVCRWWSASLGKRVAYCAWNELVSGEYRRSVAASHVCALRCSSCFFNNYPLCGLIFDLYISIIILLCFLFLICQRYLLFVCITEPTVSALISKGRLFFQDVEVRALAAISKRKLWRNDLTDTLRYRAFHLNNPSMFG